MKLVSRWLEERAWVIIGAYACKYLAQACIKRGVTLISRLRLDAQLYEFPDSAPAGKYGRKRIKAKSPLTLHFVLVVDPASSNKRDVFFSTDINLPMKKIIEYFVLRWNLEVTFEEVRAHLGVETQRQWLDRAIACTTPFINGALLSGHSTCPAIERDVSAHSLIDGMVPEK